MPSLPVLERVIGGLRRLSSFGVRVAPRIGDVMRGDVVARVRRGVGPDGKAWPETEDGHLPLQGVTKDLSVHVRGNRVELELRGIGARHHAGKVRGGKAREIIPTDRVPDSMERGIRAVVADELRRTMEGA